MNDLTPDEAWAVLLAVAGAYTRSTDPEEQAFLLSAAGKIQMWPILKETGDE